VRGAVIALNGVVGCDDQTKGGWWFWNWVWDGRDRLMVGEPTAGDQRYCSTVLNVRRQAKRHIS